MSNHVASDKTIVKRTPSKKRIVNRRVGCMIVNDIENRRRTSSIYISVAENRLFLL
jgi:hypothetical protein